MEPVLERHKSVRYMKMTWSVGRIARRALLFFHPIKYGFGYRAL
jgi:hypothetical protein